MPLFRLIRALFPKSERRTVAAGILGEATNDRFGYWRVANPVKLCGHEVWLCFKTGDRAPADAEIGFYKQVETRWAELWDAILLELTNGLEDDGPFGERARFLSNAHPVTLTFDDTTPDNEMWKVNLEPDIYGGHMVTMRMHHFECKDFRLDG